MKVCKKHGYLTEDKIKSGIYKGKKYRKCRECENERAKVYVAKNKEKIKVKEKAYWTKNKEKIQEKRALPENIEKNKKWREANKGKYNEHHKIKQREYRAELADTYIRRKIINGNQYIHAQDIPDTMVDLARANIHAKRRMYELKILKKMGLENGEDKKL